MSEAQVLVIIPHYNNPSGLKKSLLSIKEEQKVDVLIVDDGSKEYPIIEEEFYGLNEKSIYAKFVYLHENKGIEHALNKGLRTVLQDKYKYAARLDCGDLCLAKRFEIQKNYLDQNHEVGLVGSNVSFFDLKGNQQFDLSLPSSDGDIRKKMYLNAMFIHPTIMIRKEVIEKVGGYPVEFEAAEDYAFFFKIMKHFRVANINEILVFCELNPDGISISKRKKQIFSRIRIILRHFYFGYYPLLGLARNFLLLILPYGIILHLKRRFVK